MIFTTHETKWIFLSAALLITDVVAGLLALIFVKGKILNDFLLLFVKCYSFANLPSLTTDYICTFIVISNILFVYIVPCESGGKKLSHCPN